MVSEIPRHAAAADGMTLVELLVAILILAVGILATFTLFDSSKRSTHVSELLTSQNQVAQRELERVESLPYDEISLNAVPPTSNDAKNPGFYVGSAGCPTFTWNQSPGATQSDLLVINSCATPAGIGVVSPTDSSSYPGYTVYDFITWVNDSGCGSVGGCLVSNSYKRVTIEVCASGGCTSTPPNATTVRFTPTTPVLVSGIVADPHAAPNIAGLNTSTPLVTCSPLIPPSTPCNYGLNGATANVFYLTDSRWGAGATPTGSTTSGSTTVSGLSSTSGVSVGMYISGSGIQVGTTVSSISGTTITLSQAATATASGVALTIGPYSPPTTQTDTCMHYTEALVPATCGGTAQPCTTLVTTGCPTPDLMNAAAPPASIIPREYNFSPVPSSPSGMQPPTASDGNPEGRVIKRDPNALAITCAIPPSNNATSGELWATQPLTSALTLNGNGGMTIYTGTLTGVAQNVTLCIGVYKEVPATGNILDPLNALGALDSTLLGTVSYTNGGSWPAVVTPLSFSFNYMALSQTIPAGDSLGVRIWVTNNSGDDILVQYDAPTAASGVELDSQ